jgi:hypothetical protein
MANVLMEPMDILTQTEDALRKRNPTKVANHLFNIGTI